MKAEEKKENKYAIRIKHYNDRVEQEKIFYGTCEEILGIQHEFQTPSRKKNRWNARFNGNGRFPGFGLIRRFNANLIVVQCYFGTRQFASENEVYAWLKEVGRS